MNLMDKETKSKKELDDMYSKQEGQIETASKKPRWKKLVSSWLHYGGIIVAIIGVILAIGPFGVPGVYPSYDVTYQILIGITLIIIGLLMFIFIEE